MEATQKNTNAEEPAGIEQVDQMQRTFAMARRALTGRYRFTTLFAIMLALIGGVAGYGLSSPKYSSSGLLRVAPTLPKMLYANEQNQLPAAYTSMVAAHATLLSRHDFLDQVVTGLDSAEWSKGGPSDSTQTLINNIEVIHRRGDEVVSVQATGRNPYQVRDVVNAILETHLAEQTSMTESSLAEIDAHLSARERELEAEAESIQERLLQLAGPYGGTEMLEWLYQTRKRELEQVGERLLGYGVAIDMNATEADTPDRFVQPGDAGELGASTRVATSIEDILTIEQRLAELKDERDQVEMQIAIHARTLGPKHRTMLGFSEQLGALNALIAQVQERVDERSEAMVPVIAGLRDQHASLSDEASELGRVLQQVATLSEQYDRRVARLTEASSRREELQVETSREQPTRTSIAAMGSFPTAPSSDRRVAAAVAGGLLGAAFGLGAVVLYGAFDRRCRGTADAMALTRDLPLLGVVPELKPKNSWIQQQAASGVHQIRNVLQIGSADESIRTFCLTSPGPHEGKTSVALALAVSFAQSGQRTLVIDADLHGRGATLDLGLTEQSGLRDAIALEDTVGCIHEGPVADMWVMPAGRLNALTQPRLSAMALGTLIRTLREQYDTIIIDTAPLLGGPEAAAISALADAVVLTVSRNCDGKMITAAQLRLRQVGARYVGIVFNRATESDFQRSSSCDQYIPHRSDRRDRAEVSAAVESLRETLTTPLMSSANEGHAA